MQIHHIYVAKMKFNLKFKSQIESMIQEKWRKRENKKDMNLKAIKINMNLRKGHN